MHEFDVIHMHVSYSHGVCLCICFSFLFKLPISLGSNSEGWHQELEKLLMWDLMHRHLKLMLCYYFKKNFPPCFAFIGKTQGLGVKPQYFLITKHIKLFLKSDSVERFLWEKIYILYTVLKVSSLPALSHLVCGSLFRCSWCSFTVQRRANRGIRERRGE